MRIDIAKLFVAGPLFFCCALAWPRLLAPPSPSCSRPPDIREALRRWTPVFIQLGGGKQI